MMTELARGMAASWEKSGIAPKGDRMKSMLYVFTLMALATTARAGSCEEDFQAAGDPRNGLYFTGQIQKPGLTVDSALGQMQQIALDGGYQVGSKSISGSSGELFFSQHTTRTPVVVRAQADRSGVVSLSTKLARGQRADAEGVRKELCSLLSRLKMGKEGEAIAAAAWVTGQIVYAEAPKLSADIKRDIEKTMSAVNRKGVRGNLLIGSSNYATEGERKEAFSPVVAKYVGRRYRIDGQVYTISQDIYGREFSMAYLVTPTRGLLAIRQSSSFNNINFTIRCKFALDQGRFFATLSEGDRVTLLGTVAKISVGGMELEDCHPSS